MNDENIKHFISRITSGYVFIGQYVVDTPDIKISAKADNLYQQFLYENRFEDILDESEIEFLLMKNGLWTAYDTSSLQTLPKSLEDAKVDLYHNFSIPSKLARIRTNISNIKTKYNELMSRRHMLDYYTIQYLANEAREKYLFSKIILNNKYKKIQVQPMVLDKIINQFKINAVTLTLYREIAKSDQWGSIWDSSGLDNFRVIGDEQRHLISYTKLYDNIRKHPEAPSAIVINDDDMLDGWLIHIRREQEQNKKEQDYVKSTKEKGNEHFIMAKTPEDVRSILDMNDTRAKIIQAKIHNMVKREGIANEYNIQEIRQNANIKRM